MEIGERIRYFRKDFMSMTQEEFSKKIHVSRANIASIEKGRISVTNRVIADICNSFSISEKWLRSGEGEMIVETETTLFNAFSKCYDLNEQEQVAVRYCLSLSSEQRHEILRHILNIADAIRAIQPSSEKAFSVQ